jgi:N,N'-diacetyllegionaminate synthase
MNRAIIIAEAGVNLNGYIELARKLVDVSVESGVDYIKFQIFRSESLVLRFVKMRPIKLETNLL